MHIQTNRQGKFKNALHTVNARVGLRIWVTSYMVTKQQRPHIRYNTGIKGKCGLASVLAQSKGFFHETQFFLTQLVTKNSFCLFCFCLSNRIHLLTVHFKTLSIEWNFVIIALMVESFSIYIHIHQIFWTPATSCCKSHLCSLNLPIVILAWVFPS